MIIAFGTSSYTLRSRPLSSQRMVNCYLEQAPPKAKTLAAVVPSYGIKTFTTAGSGVIRGGLEVNGVLYVVSGTELYSVNSTGAAVLLGTIPNTDRVFMASDGINLFVSTNSVGYVWDGTALSVVGDADFPGAIAADFLDGYIITVDPNSGKFRVNQTPYDLTAATAWNALDFATAEAAPDNLLGVIVDHREVILFGLDSGEVWYDSGDADFPLSRTPSGFFEVGLLSTHGPAKIANSVYFPACDFTVRRLDGYTPVRISTHAVEQAIESYADRTCYGFTFIEGGHSFYALTFATATWIYDIATDLWHERQSYGYQNWRPVFAIRCFGKLLVGDSQSNKIGEMDFSTFAEWDQPLVATCTSPAISDQNRLIRHHKLELVFEQGVGIATGQGSDPQVVLDWSDDGGRTWSSEIWRSLGATGEFKTRTIWNRLGAARDRVYRFAISDPIRRTLIQAVLDAT